MAAASALNNNYVRDVGVTYDATSSTTSIHEKPAFDGFERGNFTIIGFRKPSTLQEIEPNGMSL